jgi:hypothetical protein
LPGPGITKKLLILREVTCDKTNTIMKPIFLMVFAAVSLLTSAQNVGVGTNTPQASAKLDVTSTSSGFLPPRMTQTERNAITAPAAGLMIYNTTSNAIEFYNGTSWYNISDAITNALYAAYPINKLVGGNSTDQIFSVKQTTDAGYIFAGQSSSTNNGTLAGVISNGQTDAWVIKLSGSGTLRWQKLLGGSVFDMINSIQPTTDGGYIVAGYTNSSNTGTLSGITSNGGGDYWIIKLDGAGNVSWQKLSVVLLPMLPIPYIKRLMEVI